VPKAKKLPSGSWNISIMVNGQRVSVTGPTKQDVERRAMALKIGAAAPSPAGRITLREAIDDYIEAKSILSPATLRGYATIKRHRFPALMDRAVCSITKADVQRAVNDEAKAVSAKTVSNAYGLVRPVLKEHGVNVFGVRLPQAVKPIKQYLQPEDIGKLVKAVEGDTCEIPILLAVWLGMRRSEISGICWDCVDTDSSVIHVRRAVVPGLDNKMVLKDIPKNSQSQRAVDCPAYIMDKIRQLPRGDGAVRLFALNPNTITRHVHRACKAAGIVDTTTHGLRHTNAAVMKTLGVDDRHAMARGGWSCESTYRKTYSYVFESKKTEADAEINGYFLERIGG